MNVAQEPSAVGKERVSTMKAEWSFSPLSHREQTPNTYIDFCSYSYLGLHSGVTFEPNFTL